VKVNEITEAVIGAAIEVHRALGCRSRLEGWSSNQLQRSGLAWTRTVATR
jgi:hypothetical protein